MEEVKTPEETVAQEPAAKKDWHTDASFQMKFVFLIIGVAMFVAWMLWMQFYA